MKNSNSNQSIKSLTGKYKRQLATICFSSVLALGLSGCNDEATTDDTALSAESAALINPTDLSQHQTVDHNHGPYGYRKQGYVNQDAYRNRDGQDEVVRNLAYYGDWDQNRVHIIDVDTMDLVSTVITGDGPYGIDQQGPDKAYALTRREASMTVIDNDTLDYGGIVDLDHFPRSTNFNANTSLSLVSGGNKAMTSIIHTDTDKVTKVVGVDVPTTPYDFGGSLSTGHPLWVSDYHFFMIDRAARQIQLWNRNGQMLSTLETPTSIHHIFQPPASTLELAERNVFYAVIEGNQAEEVSPGILRFSIKHNSLKQTAQVDLHSFDPDNLDINTMGSHHADFHPDGQFIYIGSAEGHVFVVDKTAMEVIAMVNAGEGAGHTTFLPMYDKAIITNHNSKYMTVIDTTDHSRIRDIEVASEADPSYKSQAHTSGVSLDMKYFYSAASHDGVFFRIDLENDVESWEVDTVNRVVIPGSNLLMGSFAWNGEGVNM